ncbi:MAG: sugar transferase [Planctomycetales bacterium]|nr:sugar transferase [Planctomycetales bacterium]
MSQHAPRRRIHALFFGRRRKSPHHFFLNDEDFHFAAECERMRVDRNGSVLSLLLIRLSDATPGSAEINRFAELLAQRLRVTDTPGVVRDGRIGILLPDTGEEGAWKLATDLSEVYPPGPGRPECEVIVYPDKIRPREPRSNREGGQSGSERLTEGGFYFYHRTPVWKRLLDIVGASIGLAISSPFLLAGMAAIRLTSRGPVFFTQEREGKGGRRFQIYKLRTMRVDAEQFKSELRAHSQQDGPAFKMKRDPRTTGVGRILRWLSIDELPQFFNVLRGEMSLVGPRPLPTDESLACEGWHRRRLTVNPGMTGVWQVFGRGRVSFNEWVRMDLHYVARQSLWRDVALIIATVPALVLQKGMR